MTFTTLVEKISEEYPIDILSQGENLDIQNVALIDNKHDTTIRTTLYFGYDKQLINAGFVPSQCIIARTNTAALPIPANGNIALVTEDLLFSVFNDAKTLLETTHKGTFEELTALADKTHNIDTVIDAASVRLGNSLLFCDMNFKIITASTSVPVLDPLWLENTKQGYCCYEFINAVKELKSIRNAAQTTAAIEVTCTKSPYRKLSSKVFHNQTQIGFLLMIEGENDFQPSHFEMLSTISHVISYTISYYTSDLFEKNSLYYKILYDMLIGAPAKDIMPRLAALKFPSNMQVLFIRPAIYPGQPFFKNFICKNLKLQIPGTHVTYHNNGIVAVIPSKDDTPMGFELLEFLKYFSKKEHLRIGISNSFSCMENFVTHYEQANAALELGHKLDSEELLYLYQAYQIYDLLSEVKNPDKLGRYCHPALTVLNQYDQENRSQLYKTLFVFIEKGCNIKLTSENLYIHRNSLVYRLNRITDLCCIDLSDINTLFLLRLSFLINRYNE
ncbi:hypothetical protein acsn021_02870 [Anaerocolumna cellulosilytica]|uniref:Uncharacterized protein n=1 Tax=Anaerocolumna cellulosilytica TaxID=433286 RepID=A0A6S6R160_9FIRM|nr:helix-turn-helix domain-containing protein [Anaerocolumna cellulosilytica]MBB5196881.1 hypothetical protein [Anaerocolumna cellulosilytica]BCJ92718.1 hypothetical protein acsn021_02870 [Anaerocolumna cellulosilytica]